MVDDNIERCIECVYAHLQDKMGRELVGETFAIKAPEGYALFQILGGRELFNELYDEASVDLVHPYYHNGKWNLFPSSSGISLTVTEIGKFPGSPPEGRELNDILESYTSEIT